MASSFDTWTGDARRRLIALTMLAMLAASTGLAQLYTQAVTPKVRWEAMLTQDPMQTVTVGPASVRIPGMWASGDPDASPAGLSPVTTFRIDGQDDQILTVGLLRTRAPRSVGVALDIAFTAVAPDADQQIRPFYLKSFADGPRRGVRLIGASETPQPTIHAMGLVTEDGRAWWVVHLAVTQTAINPRGLAMALSLVEQGLTDVVASLDDAGAVDAPPAAFALAELAPFDPPEGWVARSRIDDALPSLPVFMPTPSPRTPSGLAYARFRSTPDHRDADLDHPLLPERLLSHVLRDVLERDLQPGDVTYAPRVIIADRINPVAIWQLKLEDAPISGEENRLVRRLYFVRPGTGGDRALLMELVAPRDAIAGFERLAPMLIDAGLAGLDAPPPGRRPTSSSASANAIQRGLDAGARLAEASRAAFPDQVVLGPQMYLVRLDGEPFAAQVTATGRDTQDGQPRFHSRAGVIYDVDPPAERYYAWSADPTLTRYRAYSQQRPSSLFQGFERTWRFMDGELSFVETRDGREVRTWRADTPPQFLPSIAEDAWPVRTIEAQGGEPALVWLESGEHPPRPFEIRLVEPSRPPFDAVAADVAPGRYALLIRGMASMDARRLWLDGRGRVERYEWIDATAGIAGPAWVIAHPVSREAGHQALPDLVSELTAWEQEVERREPPALP